MSRVVEIPDNKEEFHVLAVDDNFVDRKVIERLLKISSCKVTVVESGKRALQFLGLDEENATAGCNGMKVHLIITDYSMPGMTGYELLNKIKESSKFREVPVVIMSSENIRTRIHRCLEEGAEEYLLKPVKLVDVIRLKDSVVRGQLNGVKDINTSTDPTKACETSPPSIKDIVPRQRLPVYLSVLDSVAQAPSSIQSRPYTEQFVSNRFELLYHVNKGCF